MKLKQLVLVLSLACVLTALSLAPLDAVIKKGPYLMMNGNVNTQMMVLWQTDVTQSCSIEWGTTTSYGTSANTTENNSTDHLHKYIISNLANGTVYYYRVKIGTAYHTGSFRSAPAASATNVKFFAYADTRSYPANHAKVAGKMIDVYTADSAYKTIALFGGDYINTDAESNWASEFFPRTQANLLKFQSEIPIMPCRGNHEGSGTVFKKYYPFPYVSAFYYSFDYGPAHITVIDQNPSTSPAISTTQVNWLKNDLSSTTKTWKIVVFHSPGWSAGGGHENDTEIQQTIQPILVQNGVSLVLTGDNHYYSRAQVDGIQHVTTGGGGAPLYNSQSGYPYILVTEDNYQFCKIDIQGTNLYFSAIDYLGNEIDSVTLTKDTTPSITADFTYTTNLLQATFTDKSTAKNTTISAWSWDFGDGTSSTAQNPVHTYASTGTFNVKLIASNGGSVSNSVTKPVTVTNALPYCASKSSDCNDEWIGTVQVGTMINNSNASNYTDFTSISAPLTKGASTTLKLTPKFSGSSYTEYWRVWIDYNKNGSFTDSGEQVYSGSGKTAKSATFTVPTSALSGTTRIRVAMKYNAYPTSCESFQYGEVEDYTATIQ